MDEWIWTLSKIISLVKATFKYHSETCLRATEIQRKLAPSKLDKGKLKGSTIGIMANHSVLVLFKLLCKYKAGINF